MSSAANSLIESSNSPDSTATGIPNYPVPMDIRDLPLIWSSLTREQRLHLLRAYPESAAIVSSLHWMCDGWTKTRDLQDQIQPYKPIPRKPYVEVIHKLWMREPVLYIRKSRSMLISWIATAECLHYVQTRQPSKAVFWAQDQDRAVILRNYAWDLYDQQDERLKRLYPVVRGREQQSFDKLEYREGSAVIALPGKDPSKIRGEHPTVLMIDEANFIEHGAEAFDVALASRVPKIFLVSSAAPSWLEKIAKVARPEAL